MQKQNNTEIHINTKDYNVDKIRQYNVAVGFINKFINFLNDSDITTPVDPMLYAIEFSFRNHNRYGCRKLPIIENNILSGEYYHYLLPEYYYNSKFDNSWTAEKQKIAADEMIHYLIKTIKPDTVMKWAKP